jgi:hypothetical protein
MKKSDNAEEKQELQSKLKHLSEEIMKIHVQRKQLSPLGKYSISTNEKSPKNEVKGHKNKKKLHHPSLDYVIVGIANSPYLTSPEDPYSDTTIRFANKIHYLKNLGKKAKELSPEELDGVDLTQSKKVFMKEVIHYKPRFEVISV